MTKSVTGEPLVWAECAAQAALAKKAAQVVAIKVKESLIIVDYFVVATAENPLQQRAVAEAVEEALCREYGIKPIGREGLQNTNWILLDYGDIVVHVFTPDTRDFYRLETLYNDAEITSFEA